MMIEANTEELREILQAVYDLPDANSGGGGEYDLLLRVDMPSGQNVYEYAFTQSNVSVVSGDLQKLTTKAEAEQPVKVGVIQHLYYWGTEFHGFVEAELYVGPYIYIRFNFDNKRFFCNLTYNGEVNRFGCSDLI